jgi:hypothetical protein
MKGNGRSRIYRHSLLILGLCMVASAGCNNDRRAANDRAKAAIAPPFFVVSNGQAAILNVGSNYAAILPRVLISDKVQYDVVVATNGVFSNTRNPVSDGQVNLDEIVTVLGVNLRLMAETSQSCRIELESMDDITSGLALVGASDLQSVKVVALTYKRKKELKIDDALKAMGLPSSPKN